MVLTTLHANSPADMVMRLVTMVRYGMDLPVEVIESNIASALDVVVQVSRGRDGGRFVSAIASVERGKASACRIRDVYRRRSSRENGVWESCPSWLDDACEQGFVDEWEVARWKAACF